MPLTIRRSIEVPFNVPVQLELGGGLDNGSRWLPHFAPDSWQQGYTLLAASTAVTVVTNPGGNVGVRLYRVFLNVASSVATTTLDGPLFLRYSAGPQNIIGVSFDGQPRDHNFDFSPFGLPPLDLTSNVELYNNGTTLCVFNWIVQWGREPVAIQNE